MIEQVQIRSLKSGGGLTRGRGMIESVRNSGCTARELARHEHMYRLV